MREMRHGFLFIIFYSYAMLFDSHAHVNFEAFNKDWKQVLDDCCEKNVWVINIGSQFPTSKRGIEIAEKYDNAVYAAIGLHPTHAHEAEHIFDYKKYADLAGVSKKVVAVGETGIDFYHSFEHYNIQKKTFQDQIRLSREFNLALIIHGRNSRDGKINCYKEIYNIVKKEKLSRAVVHCFIGSADDAKMFLDLGYYIGITGIITFKNAKELQETVQKSIPLQQLLIETDCPYLAPEPYRGKQNCPQYVEYVALKIAQLKDISYQEIEKATFENARILFQV